MLMPVDIRYEAIPSVNTQQRHLTRDHNVHKIPHHWHTKGNEPCTSRFTTPGYKPMDIILVIHHSSRHEVTYKLSHPWAQRPCHLPVSTFALKSLTFSIEAQEHPVSGHSSNKLLHLWVNSICEPKHECTFSTYTPPRGHTIPMSLPPLST